MSSHSRSRPTLPVIAAARRRTRSGLSRLALVAGVVLSAVALPAALPAAASNGGGAAGGSEPVAGPVAARIATESRERASSRKPNKKSVTVRIKLGQTLSMATLTALAPGTAATPPPPDKQHKWSLVASPANTGLTAPPPGATTFTPDVPGTFVFKGKPGRGRGAGPSQRTLNLQVVPREPLVCVNTRVVQPGELLPLMKVGAVEYPMGQVDGHDDPTALHVVVLERATLGVPNDGTPWNSTFDLRDSGAVDALLSKLDSNDIVLVAGDIDGDSWGTLARLGAADVNLPGTLVRFSLIGIPGAPAGSAWQAIETEQGTADANTSPSGCDPQVQGNPSIGLSGWLTTDTSGTSYTYVSPDFVDIDTEAAAPAGTHAISVGNQTYSVPTGQWNGFHAVVLDRTALCPGQRAGCDQGPPLLNQGFGPENGGLDALNTALGRFSSDPDALLFLAPFTGTSGAMPDVVPPLDLIATLRAFGASPLAPGRSLGNGVKYALVGAGLNHGLPAGSARPIVAESFTGFGQDGHIAGTLVRDHQNRFTPREASVDGTQLLTLGEIAYGPTTAWPEAASQAETAAFGYLSQQLGWPVTDESPNGIRDAYPTWDQPSKVPPDPETRIQAVWCTAARPPDIDAAACTTVRQRLVAEFENVRYVDQLLGDLREAYFEDVSMNQSIITVVEDDIEKTLTPPKASTTLGMTIFQSTLQVASVIPVIGPAFKLAGSALDLGERLSTDADGGSADPMQAVYDTGDELLVASNTAFSTAVAQVDAYQRLVVTDPAKLELVGQRANSDKPNSPWNFSDDDIARARTGLTYALKQWLYPPLVDAGFPVWQLVIPSPDGYNPADRTPTTYRCLGVKDHGFPETTHPFGAEPDLGWIKLDNGHADYSLALGGTTYSADQLAHEAEHAPVPTDDLVAAMFGPLNGGDAGLDQSWYFEWGLGRQLDSGKPRVLECQGPRT